MSVIKIDPEIMHGTPCFAGTRVPITHLFDYLSDGYGIDHFVYSFPSVKREQVESVLEQAKQALVNPELVGAGRP